MDRLEDETRSGESSADLILLLRGGEDTRAKLIRQADLLATRFTYRDRPARGISLFAATGDLDARVLLGTKFRSFPKYRRIEAAALRQLGLLLPTFQPPHWTMMFVAPDGLEPDEGAFLTELLAILGPVLDNPKYTRSRTGRAR